MPDKEHLKPDRTCVKSSTSITRCPESRAEWQWLKLLVRQAMVGCKAGTMYSHCTEVGWVTVKCSNMRPPKRPIHNFQLVLLSWAGRRQVRFHQPLHFVLCTAYIPLQAEFMTFLSTTSLMHKAGYQGYDSDTQELESLLLLGHAGGS
jgi:hypothetical protein